LPLADKGHIMQPLSSHQAYLRHDDQQSQYWNNRGHCFGAAG
jgi:hypothetical protein